MPVRDTREQPRHWFRPDSKKYMTVEMEQPFVWPTAPESFEPWAPKQRQKEEDEAVEANSGGSSKDQRRAATKLRRHVEGLFKKTKDLKKDRVIAREPKEGVALKARERRTAEPKKSSKLKHWEQKRPAKVLETDDQSRYTIKI